MDWEQANVALDPEAFKQAQAVADTHFNIPFSFYFVIVILLALLFLAKKTGVLDKKNDGDKDSGDKK